MEGTPPKELLDADLDCRGVDGQGEQDHAGGDGPVMVVDPPRPDAAAIHLMRWQQWVIRGCQALGKVRDDAKGMMRRVAWFCQTN